MPELVALTVHGDDPAELADWLTTDDALRGRVRRAAEPVPDGALGAELSQLVVSLGSGGVATAMASVVIAWLRRRAGSVTVRISRADGSSVTVRAEHVRGLDSVALRTQVDQVAHAAWPDGDAPEAAAPGESDGLAGD